MWMASELLDRLRIRICFDGVGGVGGGGASSAGGTGSTGDASGSAGDASGSAGTSETGGADASEAGGATEGASDASGFGEALGAAASEAGPAQDADDDDTDDDAPAACTLGDEGLRDYSASAASVASLAADTRAVEAATSPSQEFSPGDIDPVTNNAIADVTADGRIACEIDQAGQAVTGAALADMQKAAVDAAIDPGPAPEQADLSLAGFPDPSGLYTGFVTGLDPAGQPLAGVTPVAQPDPVTPTRSWTDDFRDYLVDSWAALSRIPGDLQTLAEDFLDRPLETTTSLANSFPQTRVASAGTTLGSSLAMALAGIRIADNAAVPSSRALAAAMEAAGMTRPAETAAHHIIAGAAPAAERARAMLGRLGIGINEAANGVFLPASRTSTNVTGAAVHSTLHTNEYYARVNELLGAARTREEAEAILGVIRDRLQAGGL